MAPAGTPGIFHTWTRLSGTIAHPSARDAPAMAYDGADNYVVLFGGFAGSGTNCASGYCNDTWTFHNGTWTPLTGAHPPASWGASMVYDSADGYLIMFGGRNATTSFNSTWKFFHGGWSLLTPVASPPARYDAMAAYDPALHAVVVGGGAAAQNLSDMWTYHAGNWTQVPLPANLSGNPFHGRYSAMAYDPRAPYLVYFGGQTGFGGNETWTYVGGNWTRLTPATSPSPRFAPSLTYDPSTRGIILFGGTSTASTWEFKKGTWNFVHSGKQPPARDQCGMAFDTADGYLVLFGGLSSTNSLLSDAWTFR